MQDTGFPGGASGKEPSCQCRRSKRRGFDPWIGKILRRRAWQLTAVFSQCSGESHGQRNLAGYSPQGRKEPDTSEMTQHACMQGYTLDCLLIRQGKAKDEYMSVMFFLRKRGREEREPDWGNKQSRGGKQ